MSIQYITDEQGQRVAVQIPIEEWETMRQRLEHSLDERLSPEDEADRKKAYAELAAGEALDLREAMKALSCNGRHGGPCLPDQQTGP